MRKKILLVTWYNSRNCGTCLQSYALYSILKKKYQVDFLGKRTFYSPFSKFLWKKIFLILTRQISRILKKESDTDEDKFYMKSVETQADKYSKFIKRNYTFRDLRGLRDFMQIRKDYDCYMVGSDQLWNPALFSPAFMLDFAPLKGRKVTYAASFGVDKLTSSQQKEYSIYMKRLDKISVREPNALKLVKDICGKDSSVVLDPTFLLKPEEWRSFSEQSAVLTDNHISGDYIISYFIGSKEFNHLDTVRKLAQILKYKIVLIANKRADYTIHDENITVIGDTCAYDFVKLIDNAKLVCTDSFHAVVFSFLMDTSLFIFERFKKGSAESQNARLDNIVQQFRLECCHWQNSWMNDIQDHLNHDYSMSYELLNIVREDCLFYLYNLPINK